MANNDSFLVIKYPGDDIAIDALRALEGLVKDGVIKLKDAVAVTKTPAGKIKLHQTRDDSTKRGFLKGGLIGVMLAVLFGPAGWVALGVASGTLLGSRDRGIKNKLLKELGEDMTPSESAVAILVEQADWETAVNRMKSFGFGGTVVISEIIADDIAAVEKLLEDPKTVESVPDELEVTAPAAAAAAVAAVATDGTRPGAAEAAASAAVAEGAGPAPAATAEEGSAAEVVAATIAPGTVPIRVGMIAGVSPEYAEQLAKVDITTTKDLLSVGAKAQGRARIASETHIDGGLILEWVKEADLMRVPGIGPSYSRLLEASGVDSPAELSQRNAHKLAVTFQEVAAATPDMVHRVPSEHDVEAWITEARQLDPVVEH
jgi:uncharacterized membrane protein/predicted flap endonuclease-1-like 5' DNA nuclease